MWTQLSEFDDTLRALEQFRRQFDGFFAEGSANSPAWRRRETGRGRFRAELVDTGESLRLRAELPGVSASDLTVGVDNDVLSVRATRQVDAPEGFAVHRQERAGFDFHRSYALPCKVDLEKTHAELKNGVLTLLLPKAPEAQPRRITVATS